MSDNSTNTDSFVKKQLKLASSTAVVTTVGSLVLSLWWIILPFVMLMMLISTIASTAPGATGYEELPPATKHVYGKPGAKEKFLSIDIKGPIEGSRSPNDVPDLLFGSDLYVYGYEVKKQIIQAADEDYRGIILEVDSPGGTIFGSKAISDGIKYYKDTTKRPVYVHVQGLSASGAYWASAEADKIYADAGTGIGSIGVIYGPIQFFDKPVAIDGGIFGGGVVTQNGIEEKYITAGTGKDAGNPFRRLTPEELSIMQTSVNDNYDSFVEHISATRKVPGDKVRSQIGAHLYGEKQAKSIGLVDQISNKETAYQDLVKASGVEGNEFEFVSADLMGGGFFGAFGAKVRSWLKPVKSQKATNNLPKLCTHNTNPLVYYGDLSSICKSK